LDRHPETGGVFFCPETAAGSARPRPRTTEKRPGRGEGCWVRASIWVAHPLGVFDRIYPVVTVFLRSALIRGGCSLVSPVPTEERGLPNCSSHVGVQRLCAFVLASDVIMHRRPLENSVLKVRDTVADWGASGGPAFGLNKKSPRERFHSAGGYMTHYVYSLISADVFD
jgi:hypothetical protein